MLHPNPAGPLPLPPSTTHDGPDRNVDRLSELGALPAGYAQLGTPRPTGEGTAEPAGLGRRQFCSEAHPDAASPRQILLSGGTRREPGRSYVERISRSPSAVVGKPGWKGPTVRD